MKRGLPAAWVLLRLPLLGLALYLFRFQLIQLVETSIGLWQAVDIAVYTASTFPTRFLLFLVALLAFGAGIQLSNRLISPVIARYVFQNCIAFAFFFISYQIGFKTENSLLRAVPVTLLLAANILPYEWIRTGAASGGVINSIVVAGVGVAEALIPQTVLLWLAEKFSMRETVKKYFWLGGVFAATFLWVFLLTPYDNQRVLTLGEMLHPEPSVTKLAEGDFNWIELDAEKGRLYAVGRSTNFLLAFDVRKLPSAPLRSREDIGKTQSFAFVPQWHEIYAYKAETRELVVLNADTLETLRAIHVPDLSPGDVWVQWHPLTDTIVLSSEADAKIGTPLYLFDRESGEIVGTLPLPVIPTAHLTFHPSRPLMYFNSFREPYLAVWNMRSFEIVKLVEIPPRTDRMLFHEAENEVWIASPLDGAVLRYDADTLEYKGEIQAGFGVRTLAFDPKKNLLLTGNFINNRLTVIDLTTGEPAASYYLGPWIRTIALDVEEGVAYVSTIRNLFKVQYAE